MSGVAGTAAASVELRHVMDTGGHSPFSSFPALEQPFPEVQVCGHVRKEKGTIGEQVPPFINALQASPDSLFPRRGWLPSGLFVSHESRILAQCSNQAASTSDYFIHKSHRTIAEESDYSVSTVLRAFREAVSRGHLSCTVVVDERTNARKANLNRFTPSYLAFVARVKEKLVSAGLKILSPVRKLRQLVDRFFAPPPLSK